MGISSILDISSFFIGMIINLIFVALMCYYFKRKYDYLEMAQTEQAKILYQMIHKNEDSCPVTSPKEYRKDYTQDPLVHMEIDTDSDSDDDSVESNDEMVDVKENIVLTESVIDHTENLLEEPDSQLIEEAEPRMEPVDVTSDLKEVTIDSFEITVQLSEPENAYSKMSMKQLKEILSSKGIRAKNNIKKDELIELISKEA